MLTVGTLVLTENSSVPRGKVGREMNRKAQLVAVVLVAFAVGAGTSSAAADEAVLTNLRSSSTWHGSLSPGATADPSLCTAATCAQASVDLGLPARTAR